MNQFLSRSVIWTCFFGLYFLLSKRKCKIQYSLTTIRSINLVKIFLKYFSLFKKSRFVKKEFALWKCCVIFEVLAKFTYLPTGFLLIFTATKTKRMWWGCFCRFFCRCRRLTREVQLLQAYQALVWGQMMRPPLNFLFINKR